MKKYSFKPSRAASLLMVLSASLFIGLGCWQLQRAEEKKALIAARETRAGTEPMVLSGAVQLDMEADRYRPVRVEGRYDGEHQFLLDNQWHGGRTGYQVLTPLRLAGGDAVLVNRGWVPGGAHREVLPDIAIPSGDVHVTGIIDRFYRVGFRLKGAEVPAPGWPAMVQVPEPGPLAQRLGYRILPYQVLLDPAAGGAYEQPVGQVGSPDPGKNLGYALQWFLFAAVGACLYVRHGLKVVTRHSLQHTTMTNSVKPGRRGRWVIVVIALISAVPFGIAWYYAQHPELVEKTSNYGSLIVPPQHVDIAQLLANPVSPVAELAEIKGRWLLLQVSPGVCSDSCAETLHKTHQGWLMLNKEMARVRRLLLMPTALTAGGAPAMHADDALVVAGLDPSVLEVLTAAIGKAPGDGVVILLDPLGNLVLWYDTGFDPYKVVKDIKHLLKASQIG